MNEKETEEKFSKLLKVMAQLRSETGCPWDKEQTHASLKPCLLEETYELLAALDDGDPNKLREELGDVLLQVVFHSQIATEEGRFTAGDVIATLTDKLVRRHPYVFAGEPIPSIRPTGAGISAIDVDLAAHGSKGGISRARRPVAMSIPTVGGVISVIAVTWGLGTIVLERRATRRRTAIV